MAVNPGELLVGFIGLQATPTTIGAAVQSAVQSGSYSATDLGVAALNGTSAIASFGATLGNISGPLATKALGGLAGVAALAGLASDIGKMRAELDRATTDNKISDSTLLSAMGNAATLVAAVAGTTAAAGGVAVGTPLIVAGLATAAAVGLGYAALANDGTDIADAANDLLGAAKALADSLGSAMSDLANSMADGFIDFGLGFGDLLGDIGDTVSDLFTGASNWQPPRDPLTLDLDGDGLETVGLNTANPILFDHDGDGVKTATGWVSPDDGFLVLDRNGNGTIDTGAELFGDSTPLAAGGNAVDGFAALAQEDTNLDGKVDAADARFASLRIWRDLNQDGISQANELTTLAANNIAALNVAKTENTTLLANGNVIADLGTYVKADGTTGTLGDVELAENTFHSRFADSVALTEQAQSLPDMRGSGQVRNLREAASLSTALATVLSDYAAATTRDAQQAQLDSLLKAWSDTSAMATTATGAYSGHALTVLEGFNGGAFRKVPVAANVDKWECAA